MPQPRPQASTSGSPAIRWVLLISGCIACLPVRAEDAGERRITSTGSSVTTGFTASAASAGVLAPAIASIAIDNGNIFNLDNPDEDRFLYRLANQLHVKTRANVIRQQLLFDEGDLLSDQKIEESERILRDRRYLQDAHIEEAVRDDGNVDITVVTSDVWTLMPRFNFSRGGGVNRTEIGIKETNLLGRGMSVEASFESDVDRNTLEFGFSDRNLGDSWYGLDTAVAITSDGHSGRFSVGKPFFSLGATDANGLSYSDVDRLDYLYDGGEIQSVFRHRYRIGDTFIGWSKGLHEGWTRRFVAGVGYESHQFLADDAQSSNPMTVLPDDRRLLYPYFGVELLEDRFEKTRNVTQLQRTEDRYLGTRFAARVGLTNKALGSDRDAIIVDASAGTGFGSFDDAALTLSGRLSMRLADGSAQNQMVEASAKYYHRQSDNLLFYAALSGAAGRNLDRERQALLGGDSGLRGYPLRYLSGTHRVLLTLEQRLFTDWYPLRLFRVGGAVFFDVGRVWDSPYPSERNDSLHRDIGIGLRLGSPRSGLGKVIHIDLAHPLDGPDSISDLQFVVYTGTEF